MEYEGFETDLEIDSGGVDVGVDAGGSLLDAEVDTGTTELSVEFLVERFDRIETAMVVQISGLAVIAGILIAILVFRFFHKR